MKKHYPNLDASKITADEIDEEALNEEQVEDALAQGVTAPPPALDQTENPETVVPPDQITET